MGACVVPLHRDMLCPSLVAATRLTVCLKRVALELERQLLGYKLICIKMHVLGLSSLKKINK